MKINSTFTRWAAGAAVVALNAGFVADGLVAYKSAVEPGPAHGQLKYPLKEQFIKTFGGHPDYAGPSVLLNLGGVALGVVSAPGIIGAEYLGRTIYAPDYEQVSDEGASARLQRRVATNMP